MESAGLRSDGTSDDGDERIGSGTAMGAAETPGTEIRKKNARFEDISKFDAEKERGR